MRRLTNRVLTLITFCLLLTLPLIAHATTAYYDLTNTAICHGGQFADSTVGSLAARKFAGQYSELDFNFTGTTISANLYTTNANDGAHIPFEVSIDGGAYTNITLTPSTWTTSVLATGLTDTVHTITLKAEAGSDYIQQTNPATSTNFAFSVTSGGTASISAETGYTNTQALVALSATDVTVTNRVATATSGITQEGNWNNTTSSGYNCLKVNWDDSMLRFSATCDTIKLFCYFLNTSNPRITVFRDGVPFSNVTLPSSGPNWGWITLASGLDNTEEFDYEVRIGNIGSGSGAILCSLMFCSGTGGGTLDTSNAPAARPAWAFFGDSITQGTTGLPDSSRSWAARLCNIYNVQCLNAGVGGTPVVYNSGASGVASTSAGEHRTTDITSFATVPQKLFVAYGTNDGIGGIGASYDRGDGNGTSYRSAVFQTSYANMLTLLLAGTPASCHVYCLGVLPRITLGTLATTISSDIKTAIASVNNPRVTYIDTSTWISSATSPPASVDTIDGTHPYDRGITKIVNNLHSVLGTTGRGRKLN